MGLFNSLGTVVKNENCIVEEVKGTFSLENACYHSFQNILSPLWYIKI